MCLCRTWCKNGRKDSNIKVDTNHHSFVRNCYDGNPYPCRSLTHTKCKTKEFWRNARPKNFDAQPPLQAASHVPQPFAIHLYFLEIHLQFVDFTCSINLHWWGLDRNLRFHQYNLYACMVRPLKFVIAYKLTHHLIVFEQNQCLLINF